MECMFIWKWAAGVSSIGMKAARRQLGMSGVFRHRKDKDDEEWHINVAINLQRPEEPGTVRDSIDRHGMIVHEVGAGMP